MKYLIYIVLLCISLSYVFASNFQTSQLYSNHTVQSNQSAQVSCYYNSKVYYIASYQGHGNNIYKFDIENGNKVFKTDWESFPSGDKVNDVMKSTMCVFNGALYIFGDFYAGTGLYRYYYRTDTWHGKNSWQPFSVPVADVVERAASATIKDTLGLFYVTFFGKLYYQFMTTDGNWSAPIKLSDDIIVRNSAHYWDQNMTYGNIASTSYTWNNEVIYILAITSKDHKSLLFWYINSKGVIIGQALYQSHVSILNVSLTPGSVDGAGKGQPIQCFFSHKSSLYNCPIKISRMDFYPDLILFTNLENLNICPDVNSKSFLPACTGYIDDSNTSAIQKKIVMSYVDYKSKGSYSQQFTQKQKFYVWNSDKLKLVREIKDTTLASFNRLIGVVEGPPPYVLNGYQLSDVAGIGFDDISGINLGKTYEQGISSSNGTQSTITFKNEIFGISAGFSHVISKEDTYTSEFKHSTSIALLPFSGQLLMKVILAPHFNKKFYAIQDYSGTGYDTISTIKCIKTTISYRTDFLSKTNQNLDLEDINTYMNRNIDFDNYDHIYKTAFQHVTGSNTSSQLSMEKEYSHTSNHTLKITPGMHDTGDSLGFFRLATKTAYKTTIEITTTTKMGRELDLTLHCPGGDEEGEILSYKGLFHWLKYTDGEDNWWRIDGFKNDKPWCMTYEIFSYEEYEE